MNEYMTQCIENAMAAKGIDPRNTKVFNECFSRVMDEDVSADDLFAFVLSIL